MHISKVIVKGFRSLGDVCIEIQKYTCLLGKNDCGKSSFLRALHLLFDPLEHPGEDDYCKINEPIGEIVVEAALSDCPSGFGLAMDGMAHLRRVISGKQSRWTYWGMVPELLTLRNMMAGILNRTEYNGDNLLSAEIKAVVDQALQELTPKGVVPALTWREAYRRLEAEELVEKQQGWCPLDPDRLSSLVQVVMLTADVRAEEEISNTGKSVMARVGGLLIRDSTQRHIGMREAISSLEAQIEAVGQKIDGQWQLPEWNTLEDLLQQEVQRFDGNIRITSSLSPPKMPVMDFGFRLEIGDEWVTGVGKMGHGLRRSVVFAMLRTLRRVEEHRASQMATAEQATRPLYLFLMEEPELYLHPQAERRRMKELKELSCLPNCQVVLCTHSAFFVNLNDYRGIFRFNRPGRHLTVVQGWTGPDLDMEDRKTLQMLYFFDPTRAAMLFADLVILVEGQTEKVTVPYIAEKLGLVTEDREIVDCTGNGTMAIYQRVLEALKIKYVAWLDSDRKTEIDQVRKQCSSQLGRIVLTNHDWEHMAGTGSGQSDKPYKSWKKYVLENDAPTEEMEACITAAYNWESYEGAPRSRRKRDNIDNIMYGTGD